MYRAVHQREGGGRPTIGRGVGNDLAVRPRRDFSLQANTLAGRHIVDLLGPTESILSQ
jgi:hypothetical protein